MGLHAPCVRYAAPRTAREGHGAPYRWRMSTTSSSAPAASGAVAANERIRALVDAAGGTWPAEEYEVLLREWAAALDGSVDEVA